MSNRPLSLFVLVCMTATLGGCDVDMASGDGGPRGYYRSPPKMWSDQGFSRRPNDEDRYERAREIERQNQRHERQNQSAQQAYNRQVVAAQQRHNQGVVSLQQQFNQHSISRGQMDSGVAGLERRMNSEIAGAQRSLPR